MPLYLSRGAMNSLRAPHRCARVCPREPSKEWEEQTVIDANATIQQASSGMAPPSWQVLRARPSFFMWSAIGGVVFALAAIAAAIYLFTSGTIVGIGVSDQTPDNVATFWFIVDMIVLAACAFGGVVMTIHYARLMGSAADQMLILMPEGFVLRRGPAEKDVTTVNFERVATMTPAVRNGAVLLDMRIAGSGKRAQVSLDNRFGSAKKLTNEIAGMHAHYVTTLRGSAQTLQ
jgi:hypothetical protein